MKKIRTYLPYEVIFNWMALKEIETLHFDIQFTSDAFKEVESLNERGLSLV